MSIGWIEDATSLVAAIERAAEIGPRNGIGLLDRHGRRRERRLYPEIARLIRRGAGRWRTLGVRPDDRVLVALPTSWTWIESWLGAVACGALPVAAAPATGIGGGAAHLARLRQVASALDVRFVLAGDSLADDAAAGGDDLAAAILGASAWEATAAQDVQPRQASETDIAFLQLTSGSTGLPRAVAISHRAVLTQVHDLDHMLCDTDGSPFHRWCAAQVGWLPLHHDMGLVGYLLSSLLVAKDLWLMAPTTFLARPEVWLSEIGRHAAVGAHGPNFGYQLCVDRLAGDLPAGLDLSGWRLAACGAEMIRPETVEAFVDTFGACDFRPENVRPCYGLAEAVVGVTFDWSGEGLRTRAVPASARQQTGDVHGLQEVACVGVPLPSVEVRVAGPGGEALGDDQVGDILVRGPSLFSGYYGDPEGTAEVMRDGWLHTGDLGFLYQGELYVAGRTKDLLIVHGHNLMPHEIEWVAEAATGGGGATRAGAFSLASGAQGEEAVVVVETAERRAAVLHSMARDIRVEIGRELGLPLARVVFVARGAIPRTSSGKVQRRALRDAYLGGRLAALGGA